jgi:Zn-dependent protease with chaperone function
LAWFISACWHQAEEGTQPSVCALPDPPSVLCPEVAAFAGALVLLVALTALPRWLRDQRALRAAHSEAAQRARARLEHVRALQPALSTVLDHIVVVDAGDQPIATHGVFSPRVVIHEAFVAALDDAALIGALAHEAQHVRDRDPLRYFLAWWALAANPLGKRWLAGEFARWIVAREAHCDREAVLSGAAAPALAHALVSAARVGVQAAAGSGATPALGTADTDTVRLRVELLLAYSEHCPHHCCRTPVLRVAACALIAALAWPHHFGDGPLDVLHRATETAAALVTSTP